MTTPQNCADCGTRAQPGQSFCDACGSVLSWTDGATRSTGTGSSPGAAGAAGGRGTGSPAHGPETGSSAGRPGTGSPTRGPETSSPARGPGTGSSSAAAGGPAAGASATPPPPAPPAAGASADAASAHATPADAAPGWDAFSRPDGGTGLPRPRDGDRVGSGSATQAAAARTTAPAASGTAPEAAATARAAQRPEPRAAQHPAPGTASPHPADHHETPGDDPSRPHTTAHPVREDTAHPAPDDTAPTEPVPPATRYPDPSTTQGINTRARRLLIPVDEPEPRPAAEPSVAPVLPGRPAPQRPEAVRAPGEEHGIDGGTPCPWCATRNRPERHFCARCAMPMAGDGPAPARPPWWRRLGPFGSRETPWAGDRPRLRRTFDRVLSWLGIAIVLALLVALAVNIPQGIQATRDHFAKRAPVSPDRYSASRSYPGHKPELAFDKINDSWWGPGVSESGQGQYIEARFDEPTRLLDLIITPGTSTRADELSESALPHRLTATITGKDGRTTTRRLTLDQGAGPQRRAFRVGEVTAVRFTIDSAYGTSAKKQVAIAEIEFFGPSTANGT
ncbi:zinc ribbon domain-containing protein [Streptomyces paradoxus]|uniref:NADase-type glycan-binding domain-containing protein n=1 Tax=Streptomyces paradoxus TaxID=66375 RepID=UPI0036326C8C